MALVLNFNVNTDNLKAEVKRVFVESGKFTSSQIADAIKDITVAESNPRAIVEKITNAVDKLVNTSRMNKSGGTEVYWTMTNGILSVEV